MGNFKKGCQNNLRKTPTAAELFKFYKPCCTNKRWIVVSSHNIQIKLDSIKEDKVCSEICRVAKKKQGFRKSFKRSTTTI
jgi:hypothetical protein